MDELAYLRIERGIPNKDIVDALRELYPKFDKTILTKINHGESYGVELPIEARDALIDKFSPDAKEAVRYRRGGCHLKPKRIYCRLEKSDYDALQQLIQASGFKTTQDWLENLINERITTND